MRALLQRVKEASVTVDGETVVHLGASVGAVEWVDGTAVLDRGRSVCAMADDAGRVHGRDRGAAFRGIHFSGISLQ